MKLVITSNNIGSTKDKKRRFIYIRFANVANNLWLAFENEPFTVSNTLLFTKYLIYKIPRNSYMYKGEWKAIYYRSVLNHWASLYTLECNF